MRKEREGGEEERRGEGSRKKGGKELHLFLFLLFVM
jgi:hypothetical protein